MVAHTLVAGSVALFIAYANGSNDVSKGIATLVGSGVTDVRRAIAWGSAWTGVGALAGSLLATSLVTTFGSGLLAPGAEPTIAVALATMIAAAAWVLFATRTGLPVSTTHAIVGALAGVSVVAYGMEHPRWAAAASKIALPLVASPLVSIVATSALLRRPRAPALRASECVCLTAEPSLPSADGTIARAVPALVVATEQSCASRATVARVTMGHAHWLTSGATSFARGMNDAPKIAALFLSAGATSGRQFSMTPVFALVALGMVLGSIAGGTRVTRTLASDVTRMDHREGFIANLVTSLLVGAGAGLGLPMSTTHVSTGAIVGAGMTREPRELRAKTLRNMALAWIVTLPASAALGVAAYTFMRAVIR